MCREQYRWDKKDIWALFKYKDGIFRYRDIINIRWRRKVHTVSVSRAAQSVHLEMRSSRFRETSHCFPFRLLFAKWAVRVLFCVQSPSIMYHLMSVVHEKLRFDGGVHQYSDSDLIQPNKKLPYPFKDYFRLETLSLISHHELFPISIDRSYITSWIIQPDALSVT